MGAAQFLLIVRRWIVEHRVPIGKTFDGTTLDVNGIPGVTENKQGGHSRGCNLQEGAQVQRQDILAEPERNYLGVVITQDKAATAEL